MKILIINLIKNYNKSHLLDKLVEKYKGLDGNVEMKVLDYGEERFKDCVGCWNCWVKTPGLCVHKDAMLNFYEEYMKSDKTVMLFDTKQGFISGNNKAFIDRMIPLYHPYIDILKGEMMHKFRYKKYPELDFYFENDALSTEEESVIEDYLFRLAHHFRVAARRISLEGNDFKFKELTYRVAKPEFLSRESSKASKGKVIIYNGSPRGLKGNSFIIANEIAKGLKAEGILETDYEIRHLYKQNQHKLWAEDFENHSRHIFIFPLYVHSMPSIVMKFFEQLRPCSKENHITFLVQSGFMESSQSHYLRPYLSLLVKRLGATYGGTIIKGGAEGIHLLPERSNQRLFNILNLLGSEIIKDGVVSDELVNQLASPIRLGKGTILLLKIINLIGLINFDWDMQLKKNGAYKERFNRPYQN